MLGWKEELLLLGGWKTKPTMVTLKILFIYSSGFLEIETGRIR